MTIDEAREILEKLIPQPQRGDGKSITHLMITEALNMAIKALEQTDVLDKVRAEIANYGAIWVEYTIPGHTDRDIKKIVENVLRQAKEQVLDIIDKYKTESEEAE